MGLSRKFFKLRDLYFKSQTTLDAMSAVDAAAWFNEGQAEDREVPMSEFYEWAIGCRLEKKFVEAELTSSALYREFQVLLGENQISLNTKADSKLSTGIVDDMVKAGIITTEELTALQELSTTTRTRAEQLGFSRTVLPVWIENIRLNPPKEVK